MKWDEYLIGIHDLPAILEAATKLSSNMASSHVTNKAAPAHPGWLPSYCANGLLYAILNHFQRIV